MDGSKISLVTDSLGMLRDLVVLRANYSIGRWSATGPKGRKLKKRKAESRREEALRPAVWGGVAAAAFVAWTLFGYGGFWM